MNSLPERLFVPAGQAVYVEGAPADRAYLVLSGTVELRLPSRCGDQPPMLRDFGEIFGDLALVDDSVRLVTAVAATDCELLAFTSRDLSDRVEAVDPLLRAVITGVMARYSETIEKLRHQFGRPAQPRMLPLWTTHFQTARHLLSFEHQLRAGLERNELDLYFQPIVQLATGRLAGFEALIRWHHPEKGLLLPSAFIPLAESTGMISDVTAFCLRRVGAHFPALRAAAALNPDAVDPLFVSVNVSGLDLAQEAFAARSATLLLDAGVEPDDVKLEVTESILMKDAARCVQTLEQCRAQGFAVAIDDFGTGYSSLYSLGALPITVLKIDRSFCRSLMGDPAGRRITEAILHLGRDLRLSVVAEGVETPEQFGALRRMGCDLGQGFLFGSARRREEAVALIEAWNADEVLGQSDVGSRSFVDEPLPQCDELRVA